MSQRDNFLKSTRDKLANMAGHSCSLCNALTTGPTLDGSNVSSMGVAAHITAAAPGPGAARYDDSMTPEERRSEANGIWMCQTHARLIDRDEKGFPVEELLRIKRAHLNRKSRELLAGAKFSGKFDSAFSDATEAYNLLLASNKADLERLKRTRYWPPTDVSLEFSGLGSEDCFSTREAVGLLKGHRDLVLSAQPGMGKTSALLQLVEAAVNSNEVVVLHVPLGQWALNQGDFFDFILDRPAFRECSRHALECSLDGGHVWLFLDGWNELSGLAKLRADMMLAELRARHSDLRVLLSTRSGTGTVPITGGELKLSPLNQKQQSEIAKALGGDEGTRTLEAAQNVEALQDLIVIPLYLFALFSFDTTKPLPTSRNDLIQGMMDAHIAQPERAQVLSTNLEDCHEPYLIGIAAKGLSRGETALLQADARGAVTQVNNQLISKHQIAVPISPKTVLETLSNYHVIFATSDPVGYDFPHHQVQEWYGSHYVEEMMRECIDNVETRIRLKSEILNHRGWHEAVLFACDRLANGGQKELRLLANATIAAFDVDPFLCADLLLRYGGSLWREVRSELEPRLDTWYTSVCSDDALAFMLHTSLPDFSNRVVEKITTSSEQDTYSVLSLTSVFRMTSLGLNPESVVMNLPSEARKAVLHKLALSRDSGSRSLAANLAVKEQDLDIRDWVIEGLSFRDSGTLVSKVLRACPDVTFDRWARRNFPFGWGIELEPDVATRMYTAIDKYNSQQATPAERLSRWSEPIGPVGDSIPNEVDEDAVASWVKDMEIGSKPKDNESRWRENAIYRAFARAPDVVRKGLVARLQESKTVPFRCHEYFEGSGIAINEPWALERVLREGGRFDDIAQTVAGLLDQSAVEILLEKAVTQYKAVVDHGNPVPEVMRDRLYSLESRFKHVAPNRQIDAIAKRGLNASMLELRTLVDLVRRSDQVIGYGPTDCERIREFLIESAELILNQEPIDRTLLSEVASLAQIAPGPEIIPILQRMMEADADIYLKHRNELDGNGARQGSETLREVQNNRAWAYERAFLAIHHVDTLAAMRSYLHHSLLAGMASKVLSLHWLHKNRPPREGHFNGLDLRNVHEQRKALNANPDFICAEASWIFAAAKEWQTSASTDRELSIIREIVTEGARLPHGEHWSFVREIISNANSAIRHRTLLLAALGGRFLLSEDILSGVERLLEEASEHKWMMDDDYRGKDWIQLCVFADDPMVFWDVLGKLPDRFLEPHRLADAIQSLQYLPGVRTENLLISIADRIPQVLRESAWLDVVLALKTEKLASKVLNHLLAGSFREGNRDRYNLGLTLQTIFASHHDVKRKAIDALSADLDTDTLEILSGALAWMGDEEAFLATIDVSERLSHRPFAYRTVESLVARRVPHPEWKNSYDHAPVDASTLRAGLLKRAYGKSSTKSALATEVLQDIDRIRREYGAPSTEPRHPNLSSGLSWPKIDIP